MTDGAVVSIGSAELAAEVSTRGAELVALRTPQGDDLLWGGDPAFWSGRAPILFPIVGRLKDDAARVEDRLYPMKQHGIARAASFSVASRDDGAVTMRLLADEATRKAYPFDFALDVTYAVTGRTLAIDILARNTGASPMPVAAGFHPAFRWPLPGAGAREDHVVAFERDEPGPLRQVVGGLLSPTSRPTPVQGRELPLADPDLFKEDALIWLAPASRSLRFGPPGGPAIRVDFPAMPQLGIWTKPGAPFLCLEPWSGYASPADFDGDLMEKPGSIVLPAGAERRFGMTATWEP